LEKYQVLGEFHTSVERHFIELLGGNDLEFTPLLLFQLWMAVVMKCMDNLVIQTSSVILSRNKVSFIRLDSHSVK
jgi:hypothetical protein